MFQDWEHLSNILRQGIHQQCSKMGNSTAMKKRVRVSIVSRLATSQEGKSKRIHPQCFMIGNSSAVS